MLLASRTNVNIEISDAVALDDNPANRKEIVQKESFNQVEDQIDRIGHFVWTGPRANISLSTTLDCYVQRGRYLIRIPNSTR